MGEANIRHRRAAAAAGLIRAAARPASGEPLRADGTARTAPETSPPGPGNGAASTATRDTCRPIAGVLVAGATTTLLVSVVPFARLAYRDPAAHVAIDTAGAVICTLAAYLLFERVRRTASLGDLLLLAALAVFAAANLFLSVLPALAGAGSEAISSWGVFGSRLLGAVLLAEAAFAGRRRLRAPRRKALGTLVGCGVVMALLVLLVQTVGEQLPEVIDPTLSPESSGRPRIVGHPLILAGQVIAMVLFAAAGAGFARKAMRQGDELLRWVALGATLAAFARLNYFLFPSLYTEFIYTGDLFRLAFYLALLVGGLREIDVYQRGLADGAVLEERRRIARDLHDGLAQDLAFITSQTRALGRAADPSARLQNVASAAERALDDSRAAIAALTRPLDEPLDAALARSAQEIAERCGLRIRLDLEPALDTPPAIREALARIVREATSNAARHGAAHEVTVCLTHDDRLHLTIADDGSGFDPAAPPRRAGGGFGLTSMRERTEALGGKFSVTSSPGGGTRVEVVVP